MRKETFTCDVCGVERKEANHWFMAIPEENGDGAIVLRRWYKAQLEPRWMHLCGQDCVHKFVDQFLSK